jgi:hypothetical protein
VGLDARLGLEVKRQAVVVVVVARILSAIFLHHCWEQLKLLPLEAAALAELL